MKRSIPRRVSLAAVISVIALVVAMGGTAFANRAKTTAASVDSPTTRATFGTPVSVAFNKHLSENSWAFLASRNHLAVVGVCDSNNDYSPAEFQFSTAGSSLGIYNYAQNNGFADTSDQDDSDFDKGEGLRFHYRYEDGGGGAMLPNGHWVNVPNGNVVDQSQTSALGSGCHFSGVAFFG